MLIKILIPLFLLFCLRVSTQEIPVGSCGLLMTYDATGNRIKREYYCNNGSNRISNPELTKQDDAAGAGFEEVDALYPNPTTGWVTANGNGTLDVFSNGTQIYRIGNTTYSFYQVANSTLKPTIAVAEKSIGEWLKIRF